jgi:two-component system, sensor histidine kinase and response regulator
MEKILIIDDDDLLREGISLELEAEGYDVINAPNGKRGIEYARQYIPDLILCDVNMPEMDGNETLVMLRKDSITSTIPVILMTGVMKEYAHIHQAMNIGADDYILKPFTMPDLLVSIRSKLKKQQNLIAKAESKLENLRSNIALSLPHELRIPLSIIMGFSELMQTDYQNMDREEIGEMARMIQKSSLRLHKLIEEYIDYSKIELVAMDEATLTRMRQEITKDSPSLIKALAEQKAQEAGRVQDLKLNLTPAIVHISEIHLKNIVANLLDNAFKFSKPDTVVNVLSQEKDGWFFLVISDRGRGMSADQISLVGGYMQFDRNIHEQQGSGLGLIIAKRLSEIYGGDLTIESQLNAGTTVTVKLPADEYSRF